MAEATKILSAEPLSLEDECFVVRGSDVIYIFGLECDVCKELYKPDVNPAKLLPCNHTVCEPCVINIVETMRRTEGYYDDVDVYCPQCCRSFNSEVAYSLPDDPRVIKGFEAIQKSKAGFKYACLKHDCKKLDRFCEACEVPVCSDCLRFLHTDEDHVIADLATALKDMAVRFDDLEGKCMARLELGKIQSENIKNIKQRLNINEKVQIGKVEHLFAQYNKMLSERKDVLITMIKDRKSKYLSEINLEIQQNENSITELKKMFNEFSTSRENEAVREIFRLQRQLNLRDILQVSSIESLCKTFEFQAMNGDCLEAVIASIGDLKEKIDLKMQRPV